MKRNPHLFVFLTIQDGTDGNTENNDQTGGALSGNQQTGTTETTGGAGAPPTGREKTFTQKEVNAMMADNKKALRLQNENLVKELEQVKKSGNMSTEQIDALNLQIESLKNQHLTEQEQAQRKTENMERDHKQALEMAQTLASTWETNYKTEKIERDLMDAAVLGKAFNARQVVGLLNNATEVVEEVNTEGVKTGKYVTVVTVDGKDKEGKPVTLKVSPEDAVKRMREQPELYGNLFKSDTKSGTGLLNVNDPTKSVSVQQGKIIAQSTDDYIAKRRQLKKEGKL